MPFKALLLLLASSCASVCDAAPTPQTAPAMSDILATLKPTHPRLLADSSSWKTIKRKRQTDPQLDAFLKRSELEARALLSAEPMPYHKDGRRLLHVSRVVLRRVLLLSLAYRVSEDAVFLERAKAEMLNAASFDDWNPSHFLDTAEMTTALALGYDWLFDALDATTRQTLKTAIIEHGLKPGLPDMGFARAENNWNSVCLCGMSLGALAVAEDAPDLARATLQKTRDLNGNGLKVYAPNGVYPEGAMYWSYGTTFQAILLDALQSSLGTDWGLRESPGFLHNLDALFQQRGPTGTFFNFSDGSERAALEGTTFWFARVLKRPELARFDLERLQKTSDLSRPASPMSEGDRTLPLVALWWPDAPMAPKQIASPLSWSGRGATPLATFRSDWNDPNAMFLALKGGKATNSHGHMDAGSFVFESDGVRWARDLGMQDYLSLESKGVDLWNSKQDGARWSVFRLGPFSHNTLTINGQLHQANGDAKITHFDKAGALVDLTPVFAGQATRVTRGFSFNDRRVLIRDELLGLHAGDEVRWAMATNAQIAVSPEGNRAILTQDSKQLDVSVNGNARFETSPALGTQPFDADNPGVQLLILNFAAPASGALSWSVELMPHRENAVKRDDALVNAELKDWPMVAAK